MSNILVTGASGFIGSHIVDHLKKMNKVVCLVRDFNHCTWTTELISGTTAVFGDVNNGALIERILTDYSIDEVYHLGAQAIVRNAQANPAEAYASTVMGTVSVLDACRRQDTMLVKVFITDKIFGNRTDAREDSPYVPTGIYETSKICQDAVCAGFENAYGMGIARIRVCNQYGLDYNRRIIPNTIRSCLNGQFPVIYKGDMSKRQYMYVKDAVRAATMIKGGGKFNFGTDDILTQEEVVMKIVAHFPGMAAVYKPRPGGLVELEQNTLATTDIGWKPFYTFDKGIAHTIEEYKKWVK